MAQPPPGGRGGQKPPSKDGRPQRTSSGQTPRATPLATPAAPARTTTGAFLLPSDPQTFQRQNLTSTFGEDRDRQRVDALLGRPRTLTGEQALPPPPPPDASFDGVTPAPGLTSRDTWRALSPPVQSREGARSGALYAQVIAQFAVGHNPRYEPDAPDRPRAHLFIWDVTRAMGAEIPHFAGPMELTLSQTCDWIRHEGPMRGWRRMDPAQARAAAAAGQPVVAMPRELRNRLIAVVLPEPGPDGMVRVSAAAKRRGNGLTPNEALGTAGVEFFVHA